METNKGEFRISVVDIDRSGAKRVVEYTSAFTNDKKMLLESQQYSEMYRKQLELLESFCTEAAKMAACAYVNREIVLTEADGIRLLTMRRIVIKNELY